MQDPCSPNPEPHLLSLCFPTQNPPQHHFTLFVTIPIKLEEPSKQSTQKSNAKNPKSIIPRKHQIYHLCFLHVTAPLLIKQNGATWCPLYWLCSQCRDCVPEFAPKEIVISGASIPREATFCPATQAKTPTC